MALLKKSLDSTAPCSSSRGGDPLEREDIYDFIRYAKQFGLEVAMTPSATPRVTKEALGRAKAAGLSRCAFSLDGSTAVASFITLPTWGPSGGQMCRFYSLRSAQVECC